MVSEATTADAGTAIGAIIDGADALADVNYFLTSNAELLALSRELEIARRKVDAATLAFTAQLKTAGVHSLDGHPGVVGLVKHVGRVSGAEAAGRAKGAAVLNRLPLVAKSFREGLIPTGHVTLLAAAGSNPRVAGFFEEADELFRGWATVLDHNAFRAELRQWVRDTDLDGAEQDAERAHRRRNFRVDEGFDGNFTISGNEGALRGAIFATILAAFERAEFEADWAEARERCGPDATKADLARTPQQRRADAALKIFRLAGANPDADVTVPTVGIVVDEETFTEELARHADPDPEPEAQRDRGCRVRRDRVCRTTDGVALTPGEMLIAAIAGYVRAVIVDPDGNVINHGRKRRLFTGNSRDAVLIREAFRNPDGARCCWPGCHFPGTASQMDHREPAAQGGATDHTNCDPLCRTHNRLKEHGFKVSRAPDGSYTVLRPDGTPITSAV